MIVFSFPVLIEMLLFWIALFFSLPLKFREYLYLNSVTALALFFGLSLW